MLKTGCGSQIFWLLGPNWSILSLKTPKIAHSATDYFSRRYVVGPLGRRQNKPFRFFNKGTTHFRDAATNATSVNKRC